MLLKFEAEATSLRPRPKGPKAQRLRSEVMRWRRRRRLKPKFWPRGQFEENDLDLTWQNIQWHEASHSLWASSSLIMCPLLLLVGTGAGTHSGCVKRGSVVLSIHPSKWSTLMKVKIKTCKFRGSVFLLCLIVQTFFFMFPCSRLSVDCQGQYFSELECSLSSDMAQMSHFCRQWRLKPSTSRTISSVFHLHNTNATRELSVYLDGKRLRHECHPAYLGELVWL